MSRSSTVTAYRLSESHHMQAPQEIPGFPGVFSADRPVLAETIQEALGDVNVSDVDALIKERGLPIDKVQVTESEADELRATAGPQQPPAGPEPLSQDEADAAAALLEPGDVASPATSAVTDATGTVLSGGTAEPAGSEGASE